MNIHYLHIPKFKNLENFTFENKEIVPMQVIVGQNGSGKSNFLEALSLIFAHLQYGQNLAKNEDFAYEIEYEYNKHTIHIKSEVGKKALFFLNGIATTQKQFLEDKAAFLPKHLIAYYSGMSKRMEMVFKKFEQKQKIEFKHNSESPFMPVLYMKDYHSRLIFLACIAFSDEVFGNLAKQFLGILDLEDITLIIKQPYWAKNGKNKDKKFWGTEGVMKEVLELLELHSAQKDDNSKKYFLKLSDIKNLAQSYLAIREVNEEPALRFFQALESLYWSDLVESVTINVKRNNTSIPITELSEGEMQLLLVLGFVRLFKDKECLFLLDEPDTHLNPMWKYHYLHYLREIAGQSPKSQILITSHEALVVSGLKKESIKVFRRNSKGEIISATPEKDMIGLDIEEILTSDTFGLTTTLDRETYIKVLEKRKLYGLLKTQLSEEERKKLQKDVREIENYLDQFGL